MCEKSWLYISAKWDMNWFLFQPFITYKMLWHLINIIENSKKATHVFFTLYLTQKHEGVDFLCVTKIISNRPFIHLNRNDKAFNNILITWPPLLDFCFTNKNILMKIKIMHISCFWPQIYNLAMKSTHNFFITYM